MGIGSRLQEVRKLEIGGYKWLADDHIVYKDHQEFSLGLWDDKLCPLEVCITLIPWYRAPASCIFISSKLRAKSVTEQIVSVCLLSEHFKDSLVSWIEAGEFNGGDTCFINTNWLEKWWGHWCSRGYMTVSKPSWVWGTYPWYRQWLSLAIGGTMVMGCNHLLLKLFGSQSIHVALGCQTLYYTGPEQSKSWLQLPSNRLSSQTVYLITLW